MAIKFERIRGLLLALLAVGLFGGCLNMRGVEREPDRDHLLQGWLRRTEGLVGVVPPREDVRVGDVHVYLSDPDGAKRMSLYAVPRWDNLPSADRMAEEYRQRPEYPATPAEYIETEIKPGNREWAEASSDRDFFEVAERVDRLPTINLSSFSMTPSEVGELVPSGAFNIALDESWDDWKLITIKVQGAETAGLPLEDALATFLEKTDDGFLVSEQVRGNLGTFAPKGTNSVWVRIVTEVIYMRALQITIQGEGSPLGGEDVVEASELTMDGDLDDSSADDDLDPAYAALARATAMNHAMVESGTDALPDGFLRFITVTDERISMRRVFRRGIAIAVRGLSLRVDPQTGAIQRIRLMGYAPEVELDPAASPSE